MKRKIFYKKEYGFSYNSRDCPGIETKKCRRPNMDSFESNDVTSLLDETLAMEMETTFSRRIEGYLISFNSNSKNKIRELFDPMMIELYLEIIKPIL